MKKYAANSILVTSAAAFVVGLFLLFKLRFEAGDVYPPYSSLRSDPLGTMALFESLARMPGISSVRDFNADNRLPAGQGTTYLHLAATREEWSWTPEDLVQGIQGYVLSGGRLVIAFLPETSRAFARAAPPVLPGKTPPKNPKPGAKNPSDSPLFKDRWGVEFGFKSLQTGELGTYDPAQVENRTELPLPNSLDWHSGMVFTNVNPAWTTVYSRGTNPVVIERKFGSGSVVLMTDSFCLSNQAMVEDRHPALLAWLIGSARLIEFDEAHLGLVESPGVVSLIRKYRLHALVAGILLVVGLFIWQHTVSFLPPLSVGRAQSEVAGKEAAAGFVNLLRRNIAPRDVLKVCFDEWTKSFARRGAHSIARVDQAQVIFSAEAARAKPDQDPVRAYREIRRALKGPEAGHGGSHPIQINTKGIKS
jgi:hypothetical protein